MRRAASGIAQLTCGSLIAMRRLSMPPATLLLRRMEVQLLMLLGDFRAEADWGAITAEYHSGKPVSTALGREESAFLARRG